MGNYGKTLSVSGLILFGTTTSLFAKLVYQIKSVGKDGGDPKYFKKPWGMTSIMFIGMTFCLPISYWMEYSARKKQQQLAAEQEPLLSSPGPPHKAPQSLGQHLYETSLLAIPTLFDLVATILMNVGLLYVTASVYQMLRGAEMLFAAIFAVTFLHRRLNRFHLYGILCCVAGICLVGVSSVLSSDDSVVQDISQEQILLGMSLIVISQAVQAAQLTFEDFFMADMDVPAMKIVGFEGFFGVIGTLAIMAPIAYHLPGVEGEGIHEDITDTWAMIQNSRALQIILSINMFGLLMYNVSGMMVTSHLGAVFRTVLETMRTVFVWLVDLVIFYTLSQDLGEKWTKWSIIQLVGFVVLVAGTLVYRRGDDETERQAMAEALALEAAVEPVASESTPQGQLTPGAPTAFMAAIMHAPARPVDMGPSSFRASQTITGGSYRGSSMPRGSVGNGAPGSMRSPFDAALAQHAQQGQP